MIERIIFQCEHCNKKRLFNKTQMKKHENICWYNHKNKTCLTCANYEYEAPYREAHNELEGCPYEEIPAFRYCGFLERELDTAEPVIKCKHWKEREE
jgi:hypothetical protein